jgi:hypothetical protein
MAFEGNFRNCETSITLGLTSANINKRRTKN